MAAGGERVRLGCFLVGLVSLVVCVALVVRGTPDVTLALLGAACSAVAVVMAVARPYVVGGGGDDG